MSAPIPLACPFCGRKPKTSFDGATPWVACKNKRCAAKPSVTEGFQVITDERTREQLMANAVSRWNRRRP